VLTTKGKSTRKKQLGCRPNPYAVIGHLEFLGSLSGSPVTKLFGYAPSIRNHTSSSSVVLKPKRKLLVVLGHYLDYIHCRDSIRTGLHMAETKWSSTHALPSPSSAGGRVPAEISFKRWALSSSKASGGHKPELPFQLGDGGTSCIARPRMGQVDDVSLFSC
jgi:hypothetical protein